eukprot:scaffold141_cov410-Prasinococcus_capsulatus_cf.AAC.20
MRGNLGCVFMNLGTGVRRARLHLQYVFILFTLVLVFYSRYRVSRFSTVMLRSNHPFDVPFSARLLAIRVIKLSGLSAETLEGAWLKTYVEVRYFTLWFMQGPPLVERTLLG